MSIRISSSDYTENKLAKTLLEIESIKDKGKNCSIDKIRL